MGFWFIVLVVIGSGVMIVFPLVAAYLTITKEDSLGWKDGVEK